MQYMMAQLGNIFYNSNEKRIRSLWRILIQFLFFFYLINELPPLLSGWIESDFFFEFAVEFSFLLSALFTVFLSARLLDKRDFKDIGLNINSNWFREFGIGLSLGALIFTLIFAIQFVFGWITIDDFFFNDSGIAFLPAILIRLSGYAAVAFTEEIFSRGYQLKNMAEGFFTGKTSENNSILLAWVVSSIVFGLLHMGNPSANFISTFNLFLIGLFYGLTYILSGSLAIPIGLHFTWNFFQGNVFGYPVSGFDPYVSILKITATSPAMISDANFGPEAGLIIFPGLLLGFLFLIYHFRKVHIDNLLNIKIVNYKPE